MVGQLGQAWILASPQKSLVCVCVYRGCLSNSETSWSCRLSVNCTCLWLGRGLGLEFWEDQGHTWLAWDF